MVIRTGSRMFPFLLGLMVLHLTEGANDQSLIEIITKPAAWACIDRAAVSWRCNPKVVANAAECSFRCALLRPYAYKLTH